MSGIITISRDYGAGGHSIAMRVAAQLGIELYDRDIIRNTVKDSGLDTSVIEHEEEEISRLNAFVRAITPAAYVDRRETIHEIERKVILMLVAKGPCIILGRCADAILDQAGVDCLNVFIYADDLHRATRVGDLIGSKTCIFYEEDRRRPPQLLPAIRGPSLGGLPQLQPDAGQRPVGV